jgi:hypothetical protein
MAGTCTALISSTASVEFVVAYNTFVEVKPTDFFIEYFSDLDKWGERGLYTSPISMGCSRAVVSTRRSATP